MILSFISLIFLSVVLSFVSNLKWSFSLFDEDDERDADDQDDAGDEDDKDSDDNED